MKDRELNYQKFVFNSSENGSKFYSTFEKRFYKQQFSFVVNLIFRLTEQFEVVCLFEVEKT